jgi:5-methylcytosine-specific restriction endonuclease McrA
METAKQRYARRLREAREKGTHSKREWAIVCARYHWRCVRCFMPAANLIGGTLTKDHVIPIRDGGSDAADNLQPLCRECNRHKESDPIEIRDYRHDFYGRLLDFLAAVSQIQSELESRR